jgi:hypothetical protein
MTLFTHSLTRIYCMKTSQSVIPNITPWEWSGVKCLPQGIGRQTRRHPRKCRIPLVSDRLGSLSVSEIFLVLPLSSRLDTSAPMPTAKVLSRGAQIVTGTTRTCIQGSLDYNATCALAVFSLLGKINWPNTVSSRAFILDSSTSSLTT